MSLSKIIRSVFIPSAVRTLRNKPTRLQLAIEESGKRRPAFRLSPIETLEERLTPASATWNGTNDALWATVGNWSASPVPGTGDTATFDNAGNGNTTLDLGAGVTVNTLLFDTASAAAYTIGSGAVNSQALTLDNGGAITVNSTVANNQLINAALTLGNAAASYTLTNDSTTNSLTLAGTITGGTTGAKTLAIAGAGNLSLGGIISNGGATSVAVNKSGAGTTVLSGVNTYTGATTVSSGILSLTGNRTAAATGGFTVGDSAGNTGTLNISNGTFNLGTTTFVGLGDNTAAGIVNQTGGSLTTAGSQLLLGNGGSGTAAGSNSIGTYNLSGGTLNTIAGSLGVVLGVNTGTTGNFNLSGTGTLTMPATSTLQIARSDNSAATNATGTFTQTGGTATVGILQMGGSNTTPANNAGANATLTLSGGTFTATTFNQLSGANNSVSTINIGGTANVTLPAFPTARGSGATATIYFDGGTLRNSAASTTYMQGLTNAFIQDGGAQFNTTAGSITINQNLLEDGMSTGGGLTKAGTNTLTLGGNNTYTGVTAISAGILAITNSNALGTTAGNTTIAATGAATGPVLSLSNNINSPENISITGATESSGFSSVILNTGGNNTLSGNVTLTSPTGGIRFGATGGQLTFSGTISQTGTSRNIAFLTSNSTSITVNNPIANNGGVLNVYNNTQTTGTGIVTLGGVSGSGIGATGVNQTGILKLGVTNALNTSANLDLGTASTTAGFDVGTFDLAGFDQTINALNGIRNTSSAAADTLRKVTNSAAGTGTNTLTVGNGGGSGVLNGVIVDGATAKIALTKTGAGTQTLVGANTYTGATLISNGTLQIGNASTTGSLSPSSAITNNGSLVFNRTDTVTQGTDFAAVIGGSGGVTQAGSGTLVLNGTNTYNGPTTLTAGTVSAQVAANLGGAASNLVFNGGTLQITGTTLSDFSTIGHAVLFNAGKTVGLDINNAAHTFTADQILNQGNGGLTKSGAGTLVLNQANTYTGQTTINAGTLRLDTGAAIQSSILNFGSLVGNSSGSLIQGTHFGAISGTGTLTLSGTGNLTLNVANSFSGSTTVANGSLTLANALALQNSALVTTGAGSVILSGVTTPTFGGLSGATGDLATVISSGYGGVTGITLNPNSGTVTYDGVIANGSGNTTLAKTGLGTQVLGSTNTYTGATSVSAGTLRINGSTHASSAVGVSAGALGGTGTVNGAVTLSGTGGINLIDGVVETLDLGSTLAITGAAGANSLRFDLGSGGAGTDKIVMTGAPSVTNNGVVISFNQIGGSGARINPGTYKLIDGTSPLTLAHYALATTTSFGNTYSLSIDIDGDLAVTVANVAAVGATAFWSGFVSTSWATSSATNTLSNWNTNVGGNIGFGAVGPAYNTNVTFGTTTPAQTNLTTTLGVDQNINSLTFTIPAAGGVTVGGSNLLTLESSGTTITSSNTSGTNTISANVGLAASQTWSVASGGTLAVTGAITDFGSGYSLTKTGAGTLSLTAANTFSGGLNISAGTVQVSDGSNANAFGASSNVVTFTGNATLHNNNNTFTMAQGIAINSGIVGTLSGAFGEVTNVDGPVTGAGELRIASGSNGFIVNLRSTSNSNTGTIWVASNAGQNTALSMNSLTDSVNPLRLGVGAEAADFSLGSGASAPVVLNGRQIQLGGTTGAVSVSNNASLANTFTINSDLLVSGVGNKTFTLGGSNAGTNTFAGDIANGTGSTISLTKTGGGTWALGGVNTYTGKTYNNSTNGTLILQNVEQSLPSGSALTVAITNNQNQTTRLLSDTSGTINLANTLRPDGGGTSGTGTMTIFVGNNGAANGGSGAGGTTGSTIALSTLDLRSSAEGGLVDQRMATRVGVTGANGYKLQIGDVILQGQGTTSAAGAYFNPTSALLTITGTVKQNNGRLGTNTIANQNLTLDGIASGNLISGAIKNATDFDNASNPNALPLNVVKSNSSDWTLSGANTYSGATTISGGTLIGIGVNAFGSTTAISIAGAGTLSLRGDSSTNFVKASDSSPYPLTTTATGATINVDQATVAGTSAKTMSVGPIGTTSVAATYQVNFTGANNTSLTAGAVTGSASTALAVVTINNTIASTGILTLGSYTSANTSGGETLTFAGSGNTTVTGAITPSSTALAVTKSGTGSTTLSSESNAFTGAITLSSTTTSAGSLSYASASAGGANAITFLQTTGSATLSYTGAAPRTMSGLINASALTTGTITLDASGVTPADTINYSNASSLSAVSASTGARNIVFEGSNTGNNIFNGNITNNSGAGGTATLTKNGAGTWALTAANAYTGTTTVNAGKLTIASTGNINTTSGVSIVAGNFNYNSATAFTKLITFGGTGGTLSGEGTINTAINVASGNTLAPGNSIGTLTIGNNVTLDGVSDFEVTGNGSSADEVVGINNLGYGGTLKITGSGFVAGDSWDLFDFSSQSGVFANNSVFGTSGDGTNLPNLGSGLKWQFDYATGTLSIAISIAAPTVTSIVPVIGPTTGGTMVSIYGSNFVSITSVTFAGTPLATFTVVGSTQIDVTTAAHIAGGVEVVVTNDGGSSSLLGSSDFTYATPAVSSVVVNGGPGVVLGGSTWSLAGQNSVVKQILVTFNQAVTLASDAFTVTPVPVSVTPGPGVVIVNGGAAPSSAAVTASIAATLSPSSYLVTFSGPGTHAGGGINSGVYDLTTIASKVSANSETMASNRVDTFFAMFGTINANDSLTSGTIGDGFSNAFVDPGSLFQFSDAFGSSAATPVGPPAYNIVFDSNLDGFIDPGDLFAFSDAFGIDWDF